jgi:hypothetical protein
MFYNHVSASFPALPDFRAPPRLHTGSCTASLAWGIPGMAVRTRTFRRVGGRPRTGRGRLRVTGLRS